MGNDCWNKLTITCEKSADELNELITNEIQYKQNEEYNESVHNEHVRIIKRGNRGICVDMYTKWRPNFKWLSGLLDKYPNCWVKNEWDEEGSGCCCCSCRKRSVERPAGAGLLGPPYPVGYYRDT